MESGHPWSCILLSSLLCKIALNIPCTSSVTKVEAQPCVRASSISCTTQDNRSMADLFDSASSFCLTTMSAKIAEWDIIFAITRSKPFARYERSQIGRHPLAELGSQPASRRNTTSASLKKFWRYPKGMYAWKTLVTWIPIESQQAAGSSTKILSTPGQVLPWPIVQTRTSHFVASSFTRSRLSL